MHIKIIGLGLSQIIQKKIIYKIKRFFKIQNSEKIISDEIEYTDVVNQKKIRTYYENGNIKSDLSYIDGKLNGICINYFEEGTVKSKENYLNDKLDGTALYYNSEGGLEKEVKYYQGYIIK